jgi:DNA primase
MFPIVNRQGQVIAFGGRVLDKSEPKYLNSPETDLFHKGHQLYNFAKAAAAGRIAEQLFVVEGYMDVIGLAQAGIAQAVAPLGTALTETQLQLCWQVVDTPTLCFDGDGAGQRAMARAIERALPLLKPSKSLQFLTLPVGEDPDSYVRKHGAEALYALAYQALPLPEQLYRFTCQGSATASPEQKAGLKKALIEVAQRIADTDIQQFYKDTLLQWFDRDFRPRFTPRYGKAAGVVAAPRLNTTLDTNVNANKRRRYEALLAAIVNHPHILDSVDEELGQLNIPYSDLDKLRHLIIQAYSTTQEGATLARLFAENSSLQALCNQAIYSVCRFAAPHFDGDVVARWRNVANLPQGADKNAFFNEKLRLRENNGS